MRRLLIAAACCSFACAKGSPTVPTAETPEEQWVIQENDRFAKILSKDVKGVLTDSEYTMPAGEGGCPAGGPKCIASGWYVPGKAYYYRPHINTYSFGLLSDIAAHEVCHSVSMGHDALHKNCIRSLGQIPTYANTQGIFIY